MSSRKQILQNYRDDAVKTFGMYRKLAERAIEQISEEEFFVQIDTESNSVAQIVKHIAGNLRSRWTDFLTSDGEKPDRDRDTEFEIIADSREGLMAYWESSWNVLFETIGNLKVKDFKKSVTIRSEPHTVVQAINRQMTHYAYHIGQIVFLAKHFRGSEWKTLSVPRNRSAEFNQYLNDKEGGTGSDRMEAAREFAETL